MTPIITTTIGIGSILQPKNRQYVVIADKPSEFRAVSAEPEALLERDEGRTALHLDTFKGDRVVEAVDHLIRLVFSLMGEAEA